MLEARSPILCLRLQELRHHLRPSSWCSEIQVVARKVADGRESGSLATLRKGAPCRWRRCCCPTTIGASGGYIC